MEKQQNYLQNAKIFKALCDESRLMILELLKSGEKCACTLIEQLPIAQSTLSHHMKILVESGIVVARKDKKWSYYSISQEGTSVAKEVLSTILTVEDSLVSECNCDDLEKV